MRPQHHLLLNAKWAEIARTRDSFHSDEGHPSGEPNLGSSLPDREVRASAPGLSSNYRRLGHDTAMPRVLIPC